MKNIIHSFNNFSHFLFDSNTNLSCKNNNEKNFKFNDSNINLTP